MRKVRILLVLVAGLLCGGARAQQTDLHRLFEARCQQCHGHAGDFARDSLKLGPDGVTGSRGQPLDRFLTRHGGGVPADDIAPLLAMFGRQIASGPVYGDRCRMCHDRAHEFAGAKLILNDGVLTGRYSARPVGPFLTGHARLTPAEAMAMTDALTGITMGGR
jgi:hypothetical protein